MENKNNNSNGFMPQNVERFNEACKFYRNYRLRCAIIVSVSLLLLIVTYFLPCFKISGEKLYKEYMYEICSLQESDLGENNTQNAERRTRTLEFTTKLMIGKLKQDENGELSEETKAKQSLAVKLIMSLYDVNHIMELYGLDPDELKATVDAEAKEFSDLKASYSMYEMAKHAIPESQLMLLKGQKPYVFGEDMASMMDPIAFFAVVGVSAICIVLQTALALLNRNVVLRAYKKKNTGKPYGKKRKCFTSPTLSWMFYLVFFVFYAISASAKMAKKSVAIFYGALTISPLLYVMAGLEVVALVVSMIFSRASGEAFNKISALV